MTDQAQPAPTGAPDQADVLPVASATVPSPSAAEASALLRHPTREAYDRELREIRDEIFRMGSQVEEAIRAAIGALRAHDIDAATRVIERDVEINEAQRRIMAAITRVIATQQPVARDLRYLLSLNEVTYELERIGDHASSVAKQVQHLAPEAPLGQYVYLPQMGELGANLVHGVMRALVDADEVAAREVAAGDDEIDHLYHRAFEKLSELMRADPANVERGMRILIASHYLERIGDRATNIAEDVVFLASAQVEDLNP